VQHIEVLAFVFMDTLDLHIEQRVRVGKSGMQDACRMYEQPAVTGEKGHAEWAWQYQRRCKPQPIIAPLRCTSPYSCTIISHFGDSLHRMEKKEYSEQPKPAQALRMHL